MTEGDKKQAIEEMAKDVKSIDDVPYLPNCNYIYRRAEKLKSLGYIKQKWISVDERLPELNGDVRTWGELKIQPSVRVLCACKQKSGKVFVKEGFYEMWGSRVVWKIPGNIDSVTHWMPLPEPPKMKGDKNEHREADLENGTYYVRKRKL